MVKSTEKKTKRSQKHLRKAQKLVKGQQQQSRKERSHTKEVLLKVVILTRIVVLQWRSRRNFIVWFVHMGNPNLKWKSLQLMMKSKKTLSRSWMMEVFTLPHSFRPETLISAQNAASVKSEPIFKITRNSSEHIPINSEQLIGITRIWSEPIPSKFLANSDHIRAIPNKEQWSQSTNELLYYYYNIYVAKKFALSKDWTIDPQSWRTAAL